MGEPFAPSVLLLKHAGTRKGDLQNLEIKGGGEGSSRVTVCGEAQSLLHAWTCVGRKKGAMGWLAGGLTRV